MAKHVISVCIFCFICATHSPCSSHAEVTHRQATDIRSSLQDPGIPSELQERLDPYNSNGYPASRAIEQGSLSNSKTHNINKRDSSTLSNKDAVSAPSKAPPHDYLHKIFSMFGDGQHMTMEGFQKLVRKLDLMDKVSKLHHEHGHDHNHGHNDTDELVAHRHEQTNQPAEQDNKTCLDQDSLLRSVKDRLSSLSQQNIDNSTINWVCPALLYGVISGRCTQEEMVPAVLDSDPVDHMKWIYSIIAVVVISACGLLGLAVIPVMNKSFYQPLLQFLVALAVGTLAGDALLHLLPHAMGHADGGSHDHAFVTIAHVHHDDKMWKGFTAMLGLIFFFLMERLITLCAKWRKTYQLKEKMPSRLKIMKPDGNPPQNTGEKQCKHKYSSFPMCYDEIAMLEGQSEDMVVRLAGGTDNIESHNNTATTTMDDIGGEMIGFLGCKHDSHSKKPEANQNHTECPNEAHNSKCSDKNKMLTNDEDISNKESVEYTMDEKDSVEYTVILREHENKHHGHSHTHGHVHSAPKNLSAVAWMVVMGDGLHNFTDGMAIGAAFASSSAGGFSTAVAVLCHELPHELGDFAVLLKAGMTLKQALLYNLLSSILCLIGNLFGLWVGATETASQWIFAVAAGMFLYIALVDMIPELSSGHNEGTLVQSVLHLGGLLLGFGIMTLIALYEHDLKNIFNEST